MCAVSSLCYRVLTPVCSPDLEEEDMDPEESEVEQMWTDLWFFFLHVLPHMRRDGSIASNQREVLQALANMDKENRPKKAECELCDSEKDVCVLLVGRDFHFIVILCFVLVSFCTQRWWSKMFPLSTARVTGIGDWAHWT